MSLLKNKYFLFMLMAFTALLVAVFALYNPTFNSNDKKPNIILVSICSLSHENLIAAQKSTGRNQFLLDYGKNNIQFTKAYANSNLSHISLISMLTGLYPNKTGVSHRVKFNDNFKKFLEKEEALPHDSEALKNIPRSEFATDISVSLFNSYLKAAGYTTAYIADLNWPSNHPIWGYGYNADRVLDLDLNNKTVNKIANWLANLNGRPSFTLIHTKDLHHPYLPEESELESYANDQLNYFSGKMNFLEKNNLTNDDFLGTKKAYNKIFNPANEEGLQKSQALYNIKLLSLQNSIKTFLQILEKNKLKENTIIIITADHGEVFSDSRYYAHGWGLHNKVLHVPLIISLPDAKPLKIEQPVELVDLVPTLLEYLDISSDMTFDGHSLLALFDHKKEFSDIKPLMAQVDNEYSAISYPWRMSYQPYNKDGEFKLFQIKNDPYELKEHKNTNEEIYRKLKFKLEHYELETLK